MKEEGKKQRGGVSYSESVRAKWFHCTFKFGFVQLICKVFLIFQSNLEFRFIHYFKRKRIMQIKACGGV